MIRHLGPLACLPTIAMLVLPPRWATACTDDAGPHAAAATTAPLTPDPAAEASPHASPAIAAILVLESLLAAGVAPEDAVRQVAALTDEDLLVLANHPAMVQVAGDNAALTRNLLLGLLVLGGIIALAAASEGGGAVITN
ncbi:MAG: hypothetical protein ACYTEV_05585 [Planctomycetota bacterium]|jgi:hypothetical protein